LAILRVAERVSQGGHHIPEDVIRRRFGAGLENLIKYKEVVNSWAVYDGAHNPPKLMDWSKHEH
jgi:predicted ABC-type ATPase